MIRIDYSGIMTTYLCPAACAHCLYSSGPGIGGGCMEPAAADGIARTLKNMGVRAAHIGGGEPFINLDSLRCTIEAMRAHGIHIDYIETNAFWCKDEGSARSLIRDLGAPIMVSVDPFHAEFVPIGRPLKLIRLLSQMNWDFFVWQERYISRLAPLNPEKRATQAELRAILGENYLMDAAREYGLSANGRALTILRKNLPLRPAAAFLKGKPCKILDGRHCHIDHYGNFVPPGCPGIAIELGDLAGGALDPAKYPVATRLAEGGLAALYEYARAHGFAPAEYVSGCDLCYAIREYLERTSPSRDIHPPCFYKSMRAARA